MVNQIEIVHTECREYSPMLWIRIPSLHNNSDPDYIQILFLMVEFRSASGLNFRIRIESF